MEQIEMDMQRLPENLRVIEKSAEYLSARKDCKTAARLLRKELTTERLKHEQRN